MKGLIRLGGLEGGKGLVREMGSYGGGEWGGGTDSKGGVT